MSPAEPRPANARRVTPLLVATGISVTGDGAVLAAAPLLAAALTQDPIAVSAVTAGFYLPWLVFILPAGALVDRGPRRRVMVSTYLLRFAVLAGLVGMIAARRITVPLLVIAAILVGMAQTFFDSAAQAIIPAVVGREKENLARVNGRYWAVDTMGRTLLGPPLGSALLALRRVLPFAVDALSFLASPALVRLLPEPASARGPRERVDAAVRAGMRHLFQTRDLRVLALSMSAYNGAFSVATGPFVLYATGVLRVPSAPYGALLAISAIGGVVAGWRAPALTRQLSYRQTMTVAHLMQAAAWAGIAVTAEIGLAVVLLMILGASSSLSSVAVGSARQAMTPDELLGRIVSTLRLCSLGSAGFGALVGGLVARAFGLVAPLWVAASVLALGGVLTWPRGG